MKEKVISIVSVFVAKPPEQITDETIIDRSAVSSSILIHRMYAKLAAEGFTAQDYWSIKTFGDLLKRLGKQDTLPMGSRAEVTDVPEAPLPAFRSLETGLGLDIEQISALPQTSDFRDESFYIMNFSNEEISYCVLKKDPYASFAGLFAAKEAIVKADNNFMNKPFSSIVISHGPDGKPRHPGFIISISHTESLAAAVVTKQVHEISRAENQSPPLLPVDKPSTYKSALVLLVLIAITLSIIAIVRTL